MVHDIPKKRAQYLHFKSRLWERYGIRINRSRYRDLCEQVEKHRARLLVRQSRRVSILLLEIDELMIPVVWDGFRSRLVSALPDEAREDYTA